MTIKLPITIGLRRRPAGSPPPPHVHPEGGSAGSALPSTLPEPDQRMEFTYFGHGLGLFNEPDDHREPSPQ